MLVDAPKVNELYLSGVRELEKAGITPTPTEYAWLYELSLKSIGEIREVPQYLAPDVFMCGVPLHPLTLGASEWWEHFGERAYENATDLDRVLAWAWLLNHAQDPAYLNKHTSKFHIKASVAKFCLLLPKTITIEAIGWAVATVLNSNKIDVETNSKKKGVVKAGSSTSWGEILARLSHEYKREPEDFLWKMPVNELMLLNKEIYTKDGMTIHDSEQSKFFAEWRAVLNQIVKNHKNEEEKEEV